MTAAELLAWLIDLGTREDLAALRVRIEVSDSFYDRDLRSDDQLSVVDRGAGRTLIIMGD